MQLILCEKENQAQHIAEFLMMTAVHKKKQHYRKGATIVAYPKTGHTVVLQPPEHYVPAMRKGWNLNLLPVVPQPFEYKVDEKQASVFRSLKKLLDSADEVIVATDPDPDGEGIARNIIRFCEYTGPVYRVLYGAMDSTSLERAFDDIRPISDTDYLFNEWLARTCSDWLIGMNITQAMSVLVQSISGERDTFNSGRVILPATEFVYQRELEIKEFKPIKYYKISVDVDVMGTTVTLNYKAPKEAREGRYLTNKRIAKKVRDTLLELDSLTVSIEQWVDDVVPPLPLDTDSLIGEANKAFKLSPTETMNAAQRLYHPRALTTYPRTEKRHLPESQHNDAATIINELVKLPDFAGFNDILDPARKSDAFDDKQVRLAKQALSPTISTASEQFRYLNQIEKQVFFLIARQYLVQFAPVAKVSKTEFTVQKIALDLKGADSSLVEAGWKSLFGEKGSPQASELLGMVEAKIVDVRLEEKMTEPKSLHTRTSLVRKMKKVFKNTKDSQLNEQAMQRLSGKGIGTPGTRPAIVDRAIKVGLIEETPEKTLVAGAKYKAYRRYIPTALRDERQSVVWELGFEAIERGDIEPDDFISFQKDIIARLISEIKNNVKELVDVA